jgi:hypothetical protein
MYSELLKELLNKQQENQNLVVNSKHSSCDSILNETFSLSVICVTEYQIYF